MSATQEHIDAMKGRLRFGDAEECRALGYDPDDALQESFTESCYNVTVLKEDVPIAMAGVRPHPSLLSNEGLPWCLTTEEVLEVPKTFMRLSKSVVHDLFARKYNYLFNVVDARYNQAVRWLKWLGYTIDDAQPLGVNGEMFHLFWMRS